jgi:hypothetical protein
MRKPSNIRSLNDVNRFLKTIMAREKITTAHYMAAEPGGYAVVTIKKRFGFFYGVDVERRTAQVDLRNGRVAFLGWGENIIHNELLDEYIRGGIIKLASETILYQICRNLHQICSCFLFQFCSKSISGPKKHLLIKYFWIKIFFVKGPLVYIQFGGSPLKFLCKRYFLGPEIDWEQNWNKKSKL